MNNAAAIRAGVRSAARALRGTSQRRQYGGTRSYKNAGARTASGRKVVKFCRYTKGGKRGANGRDGIDKTRRTLRYVATRSEHDINGERGERRTTDRQMFDVNGNATRDEIAERLEAFDAGSAKTTYHHHIILAPGEGKTPVPKRVWARESMEDFSAHMCAHGGRIEWAAVVHDDHAYHDHVHVVMVSDRFIKRADMDVLKDASTQHWERISKEREQRLREQGLEHLITPQRERPVLRESKWETVQRASRQPRPHENYDERGR